MRYVLALAASLGALGGAQAQTIVDVWAIVKAPPPPALNPVTVDRKTDALLLLDFNGHEAADSGPCNATSKPRCLATVPKVRAFLDAGRAHGVFVVYSLTPNATPADIRPELAPHERRLV